MGVESSGAIRCWQSVRQARLHAVPTVTKFMGRRRLFETLCRPAVAVAMHSGRHTDGSGRRATLLNPPVDMVGGEFQFRSEQQFLHRNTQSEGGGIPCIVSAESSLAGIASRFSLPRAAYSRLLSTENLLAGKSKETEALCGVWSVRQPDPKSIRNSTGAKLFPRAKPPPCRTRGRDNLSTTSHLSRSVRKFPFLAQYLRMSESDTVGSTSRATPVLKRHSCRVPPNDTDLKTATYAPDKGLPC